MNHYTESRDLLDFWGVGWGSLAYQSTCWYPGSLNITNTCYRVHAGILAPPRAPYPQFCSSELPSLSFSLLYNPAILATCCFLLCLSLFLSLSLSLSLSSPAFPSPYLPYPSGHPPTVAQSIMLAIFSLFLSLSAPYSSTHLCLYCDLIFTTQTFPQPYLEVVLSSLSLWTSCRGAQGMCPALVTVMVKNTDKAHMLTEPVFSRGDRHMQTYKLTHEGGSQSLCREGTSIQASMVRKYTFFIDYG